MKESVERNSIHGKSALSLGLMLLAAFAVITIAALEFYPAPAQARGFRGMMKSPEQIVTRLQNRLNLTDKQASALEPIIRESMAKRHQLMDEMLQLRRSTDEKIMGLLTKEQAVEFQKIKDQRRERMRRPYDRGQE